MKKRFVLFVMLVAAVMALNLVAPAFAATVSLDVETGKEISQIQSVRDEPYTVQGVVVASNTRGVVITDGEASVMIYGSGVLDVVAIGDFIEITANASEYNNILQLEYTSETKITKLETEKPNEPTVQALTSEKAQEWKNAADQDPSQLSVKDVMPYSWTATATRVGNYWALSPDWAADLGFDIEPLYVNTSTFNLQTGVQYNVEGYFIGFNNTSSTPFAGMMLTKYAAVAGQVEIVVPNPYIALSYEEGSAIDLGVSITPATASQLYSVVSSNEKVATWNDETKVLTAVGAGTTTLTITAAADTTKTATITLVLYDKEVAISAINEAGTYRTVGTVMAKTTNAVIISDGSAGIMVYDVKQVSDLIVGDYVVVAGTVSQYNGLWQFSYNPGVVITKVVNMPRTLTPVALTEEMLKGWETSRSQTDVTLYSWTGVAGLRNGYNIFNIDYDGVVIESEVALANIELGTTYAFQGYFTGYNATNKYASFMITDYDALPEAEQQTYLGFNRDVINLGVDGTYTLSPILGGAAKGATVAYTGYDENIIKIEDGVVTALTGGDTKITATVAGISRTLEVHVSTAISQINTPNQFYTVIGKIVAITQQSMVIHDENAGVLVYGRDLIAGRKVGEVVKVSGYVAVYNNMYQFAYNRSGKVEVLENVEVNVPDYVELEPATADSWAQMTSPIPVTECIGYTWTATATKDDDGYIVISVAGSDVKIEPAYLPADKEILEGQTYTITGYFIGYSTSNNYAAIAIVDAVLASVEA